MKHHLSILIIITGVFAIGDSRPETLIPPPDSSDIAQISTLLTKPQPRQMGLLGFTALGALMFPILVSLGMASFVSHLPTVFKEFASEFGIPATPPRNFFLFRRNLYDFPSNFDTRLNYILNNIQRRQDEISTSGNDFLNLQTFTRGRKRR
ncbi:uncharacterized protein TNIN_169771 [Trichonephila inaurata madagascariensis]|uniref:Uncharacterized protein n=1 Tax=Trichonephila inaurata madagascariensis TaxID=2747483 RepID=A0A8X6YK79_9ARAC|nr:uncharacterized protein TNIN_169771 [Trichonephila inaurata madagascariensis]